VVDQSAEADSENTLNQLLTEMDGFDSSDNVIVLASTNRPEVLDKAVLRPGRFDRKVSIDPPDADGRERHFRRLLSKFKTEDDPERLCRLMARLTPGYVGAEIANVVNEAALRAAKRNQTAVTEEDLTWAAERTGFGIEKSRKVSSAQLNRTAVHETGHALVAWMLPSASPPVKISIINRGSVLGYNLMGDSNGTYARTESEMRDEIAVCMGGRVAEEVLLGEPSIGAVSDLRTATRTARIMVEQVGFGKKTGLLSISMHDPEVSPETRRACEEEVQAILADEYKRAKALIIKHRDKVNALVDRLVEKEVIHDEEIQAILGPRPAAVAR
jgi:AFG3 family protein